MYINLSEFNFCRKLIEPKYLKTKSKHTNHNVTLTQTHHMITLIPTNKANRKYNNYVFCQEYWLCIILQHRKSCTINTVLQVYNIYCKNISSFENQLTCTLSEHLFVLSLRRIKTLTEVINSIFDTRKRYYLL